MNIPALVISVFDIAEGTDDRLENAVQNFLCVLKGSNKGNNVISRVVWIVDFSKQVKAGNPKFADCC